MKSHITRRTLKATFLTLVVMSLAVLGLARRAPAGDGPTLQGDYLLTGEAERTAYQHDDATYPRRFVAVWNFDGNGGLTGFSTRSRGGQIEVDEPVNGTYILDSPSTAVAVTSEGAATWRIVFTHDLQEGAALRIDEGHIATRTLKKR